MNRPNQFTIDEHIKEAQANLDEHYEICDLCSENKDGCQEVVELSRELVQLELDRDLPSRAPAPIHLHPVHYQVLRKDMAEIISLLEGMQVGLVQGTKVETPSPFTRAIRPTVMFLVPTATAIWFGMDPKQAVWVGILPSMVLACAMLALVWGADRLFKKLESTTERLAETIEKLTELAESD